MKWVFSKKQKNAGILINQAFSIVRVSIQDSVELFCKKDAIMIYWYLKKLLLKHYHYNLVNVGGKHV
jgi:hypothetical protein